jgi:hypothetical protein
MRAALLALGTAPSRMPLYAVATAAAILVMAGAAAGTASAATKCRPAKAKVITRTELLLIAQRPNGVLQACYRPSGRVTRLDSNVNADTGAAITDAAVTATRGSLIAYEWVSTSREGAVKRVRVLDARRGTLRTDIRNAYTGSDLPSSSIARRFTALELGADGSIAWITPLPAQPQLEVRWAPRGARTSTLLASSTGVTADSLALGRRIVYWQDAGAAAAFEITTSQP